MEVMVPTYFSHVNVVLCDGFIPDAEALNGQELNFSRGFWFGFGPHPVVLRAYSELCAQE